MVNTRGVRDPPPWDPGPDNSSSTSSEMCKYWYYNRQWGPKVYNEKDPEYERKSNEDFLKEFKKWLKEED